jgi:hypothetical protein
VCEARGPSALKHDQSNHLAMVFFRVALDEICYHEHGADVRDAAVPAILLSREGQHTMYPTIWPCLLNRV